MDTHLNPWLLCICRLQKPCFQCRAGYQEETIKAKEWAFKLGLFDCVTDWFQVRQLWKLQPEENCPSVQCLWEAGRLHGWHGVPEFQYYSNLVGFLRDELWASKILLWLIAATLKAKPRPKEGYTECLACWIARIAHIMFKTCLWFIVKISLRFMFQNISSFTSVWFSKWDFHVLIFHTLQQAPSQGYLAEVSHAQK